MLLWQTEIQSNPRANRIVEQRCCGPEILCVLQACYTKVGLHLYGTWVGKTNQEPLVKILVSQANVIFASTG